MPPLDHGQHNLVWSQALIDGLFESGIRKFIISPGSRSTPLVLACTQHRDIHTWVLQDERSAAFFALGISKISPKPAALISTSGSAPANWFPAVIEASQDQQALILISADRPAELQDCGANQTIDQNRLFGRHTRAYYALPEVDMTAEKLHFIRIVATKAVERSLWPSPGPVHINVPFDEPLMPVDTPSPRALKQQSSTQIHFPHLALAEENITHLAEILTGRKGLIVCGRGNYTPDFPTTLCTLANKLACPVLADPLSGLRFGPHDHSTVIAHYDAFLRNKAFRSKYRPEWLLRFGAIPTSKVLLQYLRRVERNATVLVTPYGSWPDPTYTTGHTVRAAPESLCQQLSHATLKPMDDEWLPAFQRQDQHAANILYSMEQPPIESKILNVLCQLCPQGSLWFCGNSMVIRDVDSFTGKGKKRITFVGNRGASGIDGNISTSLGMAAVTKKPVVGLFGDLALYHDMNGLIAAQGVNTTLIVFNNGGGAVFGYLPQAELVDFERFWLAPTGLDLSKVADLYGITHRRVDTPLGFKNALAEAFASTDTFFIEVMIDRIESLCRHRAYWETVIKEQSLGARD